MVTARKVAEWMVERLDGADALYQEEVVHEIATRFGAEFTYTNDEGGASISRAVLREFRQLTGDGVVWERRERLWRRREKGDEPGRRQD